MKKIISILTATILLLCSVTICIATDSGKCGTSANWSYDGGVLTITGTGTITKSSDWTDFAQYVFTVHIKDGVDTISDGVFKGFTKLKEIYIPDSVYSLSDGILYKPSAVKFYVYSNSSAEKMCKSKGYDYHVHTFTGEEKIVTAPTCTESGLSTQKCSGCNEIKETVLDPQHDYDYNNYESVAPTCTAAGYNTYTCKSCKQTKTEPAGSALGHILRDKKGNEVTYKEGVRTVEPTCTTEGKIERVCARCNVELAPAESIPALGHDWRETVKEEATCTKTGIMSKYCFRCGYSEESEIPMTEHTMNGESFVIKQASCTEGGTEGYVCAVCKTTIAWDTEPLGHIAGVTQVETEATCTTAGKKVSYCERCGELYESEIINPTGHKLPTNYTIEKKATCTKAGLKTKTCSVCGEVVESVKIPAKGHSYSSEWTYEMTDGNCENGGYRYHICTVCGDKKDKETVKATSHEYSTEQVVITEATCTKKGLRARKCIRCEAYIDSAVIPALGHDFSDEYTAVVPATCTEGGTEGRHCTRCDQVTDVRPTEATGHSWNTEFTTDVAATCTEAGQMSIHCKNCDATKNEKRIKPTGHTYVVTKIITESTCSVEGTGEETCSVCGDTKACTLPKADHTSAAEGIVVEPTCTEQGATYYQCDVCNEVYIKDIVPAKGHRFNSNTTVTVNATCIVDGSATKTCDVCGYIEVEVIKAAGHSWSKWVDGAEPTILNAGYMTRECTVCGKKEQKDIERLKSKVIKDEATGIVMSYQTDLHTGVMTLEVRDVLEQWGSYSKIKINGLTKLWSVTLLEDGVPVPDGELYLISVPKGEILGGLLQVYVIDSCKYPNTVDYSLQYDEIVFETDSFGCVALASCTDSEATPGYVKGDLDGDGMVRAADARLALRVSADLAVATTFMMKTGDLNGDEKITASEARKILRAAADLEKL